ncbi:MAG: VanZ family protein [Mucilaginibacter sp.]
MCSVKLGKVSDSPLFFAGFDKLVHCGFFFVMVVFNAAGYIRQQAARMLSIGVLLLITTAAIAYGGLIELLQTYVFTWRNGDWSDLFADIIGALMGGFSILVTVKAMSYDKK